MISLRRPRMPGQCPVGHRGTCVSCWVNSTAQRSHGGKVGQPFIKLRLVGVRRAFSSVAKMPGQAESSVPAVVNGIWTENKNDGIRSLGRIPFSHPPSTKPNEWRSNPTLQKHTRLRTACAKRQPETIVLLTAEAHERQSGKC